MCYIPLSFSGKAFDFTLVALINYALQLPSKRKISPKFTETWERLNNLIEVTQQSIHRARPIPLWIFTSEIFNIKNKFRKSTVKCNKHCTLCIECKMRILWGKAVKWLTVGPSWKKNTRYTCLCVSNLLPKKFWKPFTICKVKTAQSTVKKEKEPSAILGVKRPGFEFWFQLPPVWPWTITFALRASTPLSIKMRTIRE